MANKQLSPIPWGTQEFNSAIWQDWFKQVRNNVNNPGATTWGALDFTGSNITSIVTRQHSDLQNVIGGNYHVSSTGSAFANNYTTGTWVPTTTGLTTVPSGGTITATGKFTHIGNQVFFLVTLTPSAGTITSASGTISVPVTITDFGSASVLDGTNQTQAQVSLSSGTINLPSFTGYGTIRINGNYIS